MLHGPISYLLIKIGWDDEQIYSDFVEGSQKNSLRFHTEQDHAQSAFIYLKRIRGVKKIRWFEAGKEHTPVGKTGMNGSASV